MKEDLPTDLQKSYFDVLGLCCSSEVPLIEKILKPLEGVHHVSVIVPSRTVIVLHDAALISQFQIVKALNKARLEANVRMKGNQNYGNKWPSPYAVVSGVLLLLSFLKFVYSPFKWLALGAVAVGIVPLALKAIASLRIFRFDINVLMLIAVGGSIFLKDYWEAGTIVFLLVISEWLEARASHKATAVMSSLMNIAPQTAILADTGDEVNANEVKVNTRLAVKAGTMIPIDGIVVEGKCEVDEKALTGESFPVCKQVDSIVYAGTLNLNGYISVKTTAVAEACVVAKMAKLVEEAQNNKSKTQRYIDECAKYYTPAVCVVAACVAAIPAAMRAHNLDKWYHMALVVLVSACPCALILSTPIAAFFALSKAATSGLLVKGAEYLEILSTVKFICFDKTGTITRGEFSVSSFQTLIDTDKLLYWVSSIESKSSHPMAAALVDYAQSHLVEPQPDNVEEFKDFPGEGIYGKIDGKDVYIGNKKIAIRAGCSQVPSEITNQGRSTGYIFLGSLAAGVFSLSDSCRIGVKQALEELKSMGIKTAMLTGDCKEAANYAQNQVGGVLDMVCAGLLPQDKARIIKEVQRESRVAMVGDGLNDAPALATADIGISMGVSGSALANETGHVILMSNDIRKIPIAVRLARRTCRKIFENIFIAMVIKAGVIALAIAGHPLVWAAVLADMGTCLLVIFNSMLLLHGVSSRTIKKQPICLRKDEQILFSSNAQDKCCDVGNCGSEVKKNCCGEGKFGSEIKDTCCDVSGGVCCSAVKEKCSDVGGDCLKVKDNCCVVGGCGSKVKENCFNVDDGCCRLEVNDKSGCMNDYFIDVKDNVCGLVVKDKCCDAGDCGLMVKPKCCDLGDGCGSKVKDKCYGVDDCSSYFKEKCYDVGGSSPNDEDKCRDVSIGACGLEVENKCCDVVGYGSQVKGNCCDTGKCGSKVKDKYRDVGGYGLAVKAKCCDMGGCDSEVKNICYNAVGCGSKTKVNCSDVGGDFCGSEVKDTCFDVASCGSKVKVKCNDVSGDCCGSEVKVKCCDVGGCGSKNKDKFCDVGGFGLNIKEECCDLNNHCCDSKVKGNCCDTGKCGSKVKDKCRDVGGYGLAVKAKCCDMGGCGSEVKNMCYDAVGCGSKTKVNYNDVGGDCCGSEVKDTCFDVASYGSKVEVKCNDVGGVCCGSEVNDKCYDVGGCGSKNKENFCDVDGRGSNIKEECCDLNDDCSDSDVKEKLSDRLYNVGGCCLEFKDKCCDVGVCGLGVKENCCEEGGCGSKFKNKCSDVASGCCGSKGEDKCFDVGGCDLDVKEKCCDIGCCNLELKDKSCDVGGCGSKFTKNHCDVGGGCCGSLVKDNFFNVGGCCSQVKDKCLDVSGCGSKVKSKCSDVVSCGSEIQEVKIEEQPYKLKQLMQEAKCCKVNIDLESQSCGDPVKKQGECNSHSYFASEELEESFIHKCCGFQECGCLSEIVIK